MMIVGIGIDLVKSDRIQAAVERWKDRFLSRIFTTQEQTYAFEYANPYPHLSARFAAKEALLKALGTGLRQGIRWVEMEIINSPEGKPELIVSGRVQELILGKRVSAIHLSLSHDGEYAIGQVILT